MYSSQIEKEEDYLAEQYNNGEMSLQEFNKEMKDLQRSYRDAALESAEEAYQKELNRW